MSSFFLAVTMDPDIKNFSVITKNLKQCMSQPSIPLTHVLIRQPVSRLTFTQETGVCVPSHTCNSLSSPHFCNLGVTQVFSSFSSFIMENKGLLCRAILH